MIFFNDGLVLDFSICSVQELTHDCDGTDPHLKYLGPFVKAELAGKARKCDMFRKKCSQSIFAK